MKKSKKKKKNKKTGRKRSNSNVCYKPYPRKLKKLHTYVHTFPSPSVRSNYQPSTVGIVLHRKREIKDKETNFSKTPKLCSYLCIDLIESRHIAMKGGEGGEGHYPTLSPTPLKKSHGKGNKRRTKTGRFSIFDDSTEFGNSVRGCVERECVGIVHPPVAATPNVPLLLRWLFTKVYRVVAASSGL